MKPKWCFWAIRQDTMFGGHQTLHITTNTPSPLRSTVVAVSRCGDASQQPRIEHSFWLMISWEGNYRFSSDLGWS
uniref:Uncharacterized protein n=1 Tax=Monopterus albus TaxID=43700 RepID=A0A3Q3J3J8_MONAL